MNTGFLSEPKANVEYRLRGRVVRHVAFLSLHHAVLGPHSSRLQQPAAFCFSFPRPPFPFFFVISQILAAFSYRYVVEIVTLSDGWYLVCWSGCEVAHLSTSHRLGLLSGRLVLRGVRPNNAAIYAYISSH